MQLNNHAYMLIRYGIYLKKGVIYESILKVKAKKNFTTLLKQTKAHSERFLKQTHTYRCEL